MNAESGRIYTDMLVSNSRLYRKEARLAHPRERGTLTKTRTGDPPPCMRDRRDAAELGFYKACKTARACRQLGLEVKYPHKRKRWRPTSWKKLTNPSARWGLEAFTRTRAASSGSVSTPQPAAVA